MERTDLRLGKVNYSDVAYEYILREILSQRLQPGAPLRPENIATAVNLSPTPIKQALARLAGEGLVDLRAGQCPRVSAPTVDEILEMYDVRSVFEGHAVQRGISRVDDDFLAEMDRLVCQFEGAVAARGTDYESRRMTADIDLEIHLHIMSLWPNSKVQIWYRQLNVLLTPFNLSPTTDSHMEQSIYHHRAVYQALKSRDAEAAASVLRQHIEGASRTFLESMGMQQLQGPLGD